jgi:MYXO-CTERM domain-containing protein
MIAILGVPSTSKAHFILTSPPSTFEQNGLGDPQKAPPCGDQGSAVATGEVMSIQGGDTITVTIDETIFHPGHYRIALALDDGIFPEEPPVTPGTTDCGSAPIDPAPVFPVLADGLWVHTEPFAGPQSVDITIPDDVSCTNCTLQVIQFMSNHGLNNPGGCYYHHCATLAVESDPVGATEGSTTAPGDGTGAMEDESGFETSSGGPSSATGADGTAGGVEDTSTVGPGTSDVTVTDGDSAPADDDEGGCSCSAPGDAPHGRGAFGMLLGLFGLAGLRLQRRRS